MFLVSDSLFCFFFFFSSRRRHTRLQGDWSSDVCSSDLGSTPAYRPVLDVEGWGDAQPELNRLSKNGQWAEMADVITDEMISTIAVHGTPEQCAAEIVRRYGDVADRVCAYFPFYEPSDELVAEFVVALREASSAR